MKALTLTYLSNTFTFTEISDLEGFEFPDIKAVVEDVASKEGAAYLNSFAGRRNLSWRGTIRASVGSKEIYELRRDLERVCRPGGLKLLKFTTLEGDLDEDLHLQTHIEITSFLMKYRKWHPVFLIDAVAPDWRLFSQTLKTDDTPITDPDPLTVANAGNESTHPILTITGAGTKFTITNETTGKSIIITHTLPSTETIVIDTAHRTAVLENGNSVFNILSGDPIKDFVLTPGNNAIDFQVENDDAETKLKIDWRDAYLGV